MEQLNSTVNNWDKVYTAIRNAVRGSPTMTRAQIQLGMIYDRAATRVTTVKWPKITLLWVDMFRKLFQDPFEFVEKIKKGVFTGKVEKFRVTWKRMAKLFYRSSLHPKMNLLRGGPWQKLARRRLAYFSGTKQPRAARVVGRVENSPSARIVALLEPAKYPQPKPYVAGRKGNLTGFASLRRPAPPSTRPASRRPARLMPNHARSIVTWIAGEQAKRKDRKLFTKRVRKGDAHAKMGQRAKAMRSYRKALRLSPKNAAVLERVGLLQSQLGDLSGALGTAQKLESLNHDKAAERVRTAANKAAR
ncbi:MAG: tetratricopeptide repeat protein [Deltaproteobacteria bacterium]|nr:tetratricopeptide repeat protein [Deltaproteobacteria bacterium]